MPAIANGASVTVTVLAGGSLNVLGSRYSVAVNGAAAISHRRTNSYGPSQFDTNYVIAALEGDVSYQGSLVSVATPGTVAANLGGAGAKQTSVSITAASGTVANDRSQFYKMNRATAQVLNVPAGLTAFLPDDVLNVIKRGAGAVTITPAAGVTINGATSSITMGGTSLVLLNEGLDTWFTLGSFT